MGFATRLPLGVKVSLLSVLVLGLLLSGIVVLLNRGMNSLAVEVGQRRAAQEAEVVQRRFQEADQDLLASTKLLASTAGLVDAAAAQDAPRTYTAAAAGAAAHGLDRVVVFDAQGGQLATAGAGVGAVGAREDSMRSLALIGIETRSLLIAEAAAGAPAQLAAAVPLRDATGNIVGGLLACRTIDQPFLNDLNLSRADIRLALLAPGQVLAYSAAVSPTAAIAAALLDSTALEEALSRKIHVADSLVTLQGVAYASAHVPVTVDPTARAVIGILVDVSALTVPQRQLAGSLVTTVGFLTLASAGALFLLIWRGVSVPLTRLRSATAGLAAGDYQRRVQVRSRDEIGQLAGAFNAMAGAIEEREVALQRTLAAEQEQHGRLQLTAQRYADTMAAVAQGDLAHRVALDEEDDAAEPLRLLGNSLNQMIDSLQGMAIRIRDTAAGLSAAAAEILATTTQQAAGASEQAAAVAQSSSTMDEVSVLAAHTAEQARAVARASQRTAEVSQAGQDAVAETIRSVEQVGTRVEMTVDSIGALATQARTIDRIILTVDDLAAQSNLVALNAAVEAARAGAAGRGFAAVADAVRVLAMQSHAATEQAHQILREVQQRIGSVKVASQAETEHVTAGVDLARKAGKAIMALGQSVAESAQAATQIASAAEQQVAGMEQIAVALESIERVAAQGAVGLQQTSHAAANLDNLAAKLLEAVEQYRL